jgi:ABC-type multidrug transport system ATPase subunit
MEICAGVGRFDITKVSTGVRSVDPGENGVVLEQVRVVYRNGTVGLVSLSLSARPGECLGVLGPNGAGKTTALNVMSTALPATSGRIAVSGLTLPKDCDAIRKVLGVCPQEYALDPLLSVEDNLIVAGLAHRLRGRELRKVVSGILDRFQLTDKRLSPIAHLSGGQARRVQLARAFLGHPKVLILDEPTLGVDPVGLQALEGLIREETKQGTVIILATNDMEGGGGLCDAITFISRGTAVASGPRGWFVREYGGNELLELTLRERIGDELIGLLREDTVQSVGENSVLISTPSASGCLARLLDTRASWVGAIANIEIRKPTLRDAFLKLVSQDKEEVHARGHLP